MRHSEFLDSFRAKLAQKNEPNPHRKTMEHVAEDNRRAAKARQTVRRKTAPNQRAFTHKMGPNHCVAQFTPEDYPIVSGSSINRKPVEKERKPKNPNPNTVHRFGPRSRGKVRDKCAMLWHATPPRHRMFLTLTFIQQITDADASKLFNKFRKEIKKACPNFQFIRVAEHQENGNIHYHLLCNRYLKAKTWNALWVLQQYNAGLRGRRKSGEEIPMEEITARYKEGTIGGVLNPAQMRKPHNVTGLGQYLTAYVTKQDKDVEFGCLPWHCSRTVSKLFTRQVVSPSTFASLCGPQNYKVDTKTGECWAAQVIRHQFFTLVYVNNKANAPPIMAMVMQINRWLMAGLKLSRDDLRLLDGELYRKKICNEAQARILATKPIRPIDHGGTVTESRGRRPSGRAEFKRDNL